MPLRLSSAGQTHVGMKRGHNEDSLYLYKEENLFIVADGMGGHASGEVASRMAVETVSLFFKETAEDEERTWPFKMDKALSYEENRVVTGVKLANKQIFEHAQTDIRLKGMGTTIVAVRVHEKEAFVSHVGDSRVYILREGKLRQITEDHSLLNDYIKIKKLTPEEIENFPHKNVIVRALGMKDFVQVDTEQVEVQKEDIFLLCSDGLSGLVTDKEMQDLLNLHKDDLDKCCTILIDAANANGGNDNITAVLIRIDDL